jgi:predicted phosphoribosyltransferase
VDQSWFQRATLEQQQEAHRRYRKYLGDRPRVPVTGKLAILVDDGIATGLTMEAAIIQARKHEPGRLVVAVPVVPGDTAARLRRLVDEVVAVDIPVRYLGAVGAYYEDFQQVSDEDVIRVLAEYYQEGEAAWQRTTSRA